MAGKTKKQHYVPRCYLEAWKVQDKYQTFVYDKVSNSSRTNSIRDIASENCFYDINPTEILSEQVLNRFREQGLEWDCETRSQGIEKAFSEELEGTYSTILKSIIEKAAEATTWHINNCFFISKENKDIFAACLAFQLLRTKQIRNRIYETADCLTQYLRDIGASDEMVKEYTLTTRDVKNIHAQMLMSMEDLSETTLSLLNLKWILGVNKTGKCFYTSDSPIGRAAHFKDRYSAIAIAGLRTKGIELFFPVSPKTILIMYDANYYKTLQNLDRRYVIIDKENEIDYYNSLSAIQCERCIFSCDGDFSLIKSITEKSPDVLKQPHVQLRFGNKVYYPQIDNWSN